MCGTGEGLLVMLLAVLVGGWPSVGRAQSVSLQDFEETVLFHLGGAVSLLSGAVADDSDGFTSLALESAPADADGFAGGIALQRPTHVAPGADPVLTFFVRGDTLHDVVLGVRLHEDDDGDGAACCENDDMMGYEVEVARGSGWQHVGIPFSAFVDLNAGGNGVLDPEAVRAGGNGELARVIFEVLGLPEGVAVSLGLDDVVILSDQTPVGFVSEFEETGRFVVGDGAAPVVHVARVEEHAGTSGTHVLEVRVGPAAGAETVGGVGLRRRTHLPDLGAACCMAVTVRPDPMHPLALRVLLREDDDGDGAFDVERDDLYESVLHLAAGDAFQRFTFSYDRFTDANPGGNGRLDPVARRAGGNGELLDVLFELRGVPLGATVSVVLDDLILAGASPKVVDVEVPASTAFAVSPAAPNPFRQRTQFEVNMPVPQHVRAEVFDALGRRVAVLHDGVLSKGSNALDFEAGDLPGGIYYLRVTSAAGSVVRPVVHL